MTNTTRSNDINSRRHLSPPLSTRLSTCAHYAPLAHHRPRAHAASTTRAAVRRRPEPALICWTRGRESFEKRAQCIRDQYSQTDRDDIQIQRALHLGEDIAALGVKLIGGCMAGATERGASPARTSTPEQRLCRLRGWACTNDRPRNMRVNAPVDPHSPRLCASTRRLKCPHSRPHSVARRTLTREELGPARSGEVVTSRGRYGRHSRAITPATLSACRSCRVEGFVISGRRVAISERPLRAWIVLRETIRGQRRARAVTVLRLLPGSFTHDSPR